MVISPARRKYHPKKKMKRGTKFGLKKIALFKHGFSVPCTRRSEKIMKVWRQLKKFGMLLKLLFQ